MSNLKILDITSPCGNLTRRLHLMDPHPNLKVIKEIFDVDVNDFKPAEDPVIKMVGQTSGHEIFIAEDGQYYYLSHITVLEDFFITYKYLVSYQIPDYVEPHKSMLSTKTVYALDDVNVLVTHEEINTFKQSICHKPKKFQLLLEDHEKLLIAPFARERLKKNPNYKPITDKELRERHLERKKLLIEKKAKHEELLDLYIKANQEFDGSMLIKHLADNVYYRMFTSTDVIKGRVAVGRYLILRMKFWQKMSGIGRFYEKAYFGKIDPFPCLILNTNEGPNSMIFFSINADDKIDEIQINDFQIQFESIQKVKSFDYETIH